MYFMTYQHVLTAQGVPLFHCSIRNVLLSPITLLKLQPLCNSYVLQTFNLLILCTLRGLVISQQFSFFLITQTEKTVALSTLYRFSFGKMLYILASWFVRTCIQPYIQTLSFSHCRTNEHAHTHTHIQAEKQNRSENLQNREGHACAAHLNTTFCVKNLQLYKKYCCTRFLVTRERKCRYISVLANKSKPKFLCVK